MPSVFVTRKIPENGLKMLRDHGYEVDVSPFNRPLTKEELITFLKAKPYDAVLSLLNDKIDVQVYDAAPTVKIFANYTIGYDNFDIPEGKKRGVCLTNACGGGADRVAEFTWGLILALTCRVTEGDNYMRQGKYNGWDPMLFYGMQMSGKVIGLIGVGHIGSSVARIASQGFGMRVAYYDVNRNVEIENKYKATYWPTVEEVLKQADVVSLHVPLLDSTHHLINETRLNLMKPTSYLINTSRGPVIDEVALVKALNEKKIAGAGLDVYEFEPKLTEGLVSLSNVVLTPHIASSTLEAREDMARIAAENIIDTLEGGKPRDLVYN